MKRCLAVLGLCAVPQLAAALQIQAITVGHEGARYRMDMRVTLAVPAARAYAVFADWTRLPELNPAVREVRKLPQADPPPGTAPADWLGATPDLSQRIFTAVHVCVLLFCRTVHQVQDIDQRAVADGGWLRAVVVPALSDLRYGHAQWMFSGDAKQTELRASIQVEPDFWIPPVVGPALLASKMREEVETTSAGIERLAQQRPLPASR